MDYTSYYVNLLLDAGFELGFVFTRQSHSGVLVFFWKRFQKTRDLVTTK